MIRVQEQDFDVGVELEKLAADHLDIGAVVSFTGLVRAQDGAVEAMTLEHYPAMTEKRLAEIEATARARWPLDAVLIVHRVGKLAPGERIVLVATASAHRQAAFDACNFLIDWLKTKAPFWKLEQTGTGENWVEAKETDDQAAARWSGKSKMR